MSQKGKFLTHARTHGMGALGEETGISSSVLSQAAEPPGILSMLAWEEMKLYGDAWYFLGLERQVKPLSFIKLHYSLFCFLPLFLHRPQS